MKAKKLYFWKENTSDSEGKLKIQEKQYLQKGKENLREKIFKYLQSASLYGMSKGNKK